MEERPGEGGVKAWLGVELLLLQRSQSGDERVGHELELEWTGGQAVQATGKDEQDALGRGPPQSRRREMCESARRS